MYNACIVRKDGGRGHLRVGRGEYRTHRPPLTPKEAEQALQNDPVDLAYEVVNDEDRWTLLGHTNDFRVLMIVWTLRVNEVVRVITARQARKRESQNLSQGERIRSMRKLVVPRFASEAEEANWWDRHSDGRAQSGESDKDGNGKARRAAARNPRTAPIEEHYDSDAADGHRARSNFGCRKGHRLSDLHEDAPQGGLGSSFSPIIQTGSGQTAFKRAVTSDADRATIRVIGVIRGITPEHEGGSQSFSDSALL